MRFSNLQKIAHAADRSYRIKQCGPDLQFNVPNCPASLTKKDADAARKELSINDRIDDYEKYLLSAEMSKNNRIRPKFKENIAHHEHWDKEIK